MWSSLSFQKKTEKTWFYWFIDINIYGLLLKLRKLLASPKLCYLFISESANFHRSTGTFFKKKLKLENDQSKDVDRQVDIEHSVSATVENILDWKILFWLFLKAYANTQLKTRTFKRYALIGNWV